MSDHTCPFCGDGMESVGTLNHIECVAALMADNAGLAAESDLVIGSIACWVNRLPKELGAAIAEGQALARHNDTDAAQ